MTAETPWKGWQPSVKKPKLSVKLKKISRRTEDGLPRKPRVASKRML